MKKTLTFLSVAILLILTSVVYGQHGAPPSGTPQYQGTLTQIPATVYSAALAFTSNPETDIYELTFTGVVYNISGSNGWNAHLYPGGEAMFVAIYSSSWHSLQFIARFRGNGELIGWGLY